MEGVVRPFSLTEDKFDQSTYIGRCRKMMEITDPRVVLISEDRVRYALKLLREYQVILWSESRTNFCPLGVSILLAGTTL